MRVTVNPTVKINDESIPDFKSFSTSEQLGLAESSFDIQLERPIEVTTDDTASIKYNIGGQDYDLVKDKKVEVTGLSANQSSIHGEGSLISRYGPYRTIIFINDTWLKKAYPNAILSNGVILNPQVGVSSGQGDKKINGVSSNRLFIEELPGKDIKDHEFLCIVLPTPSYSAIKQYIAEKTGYTIKCNLPELYVQKVFTISPGETFFSVLNRLYGFWNPMIYIKEMVVYIVDAGGDAQDHPKGTGVINITEDSFSVLRYNTSDIDEIVDHLTIVGPSSNWTYRGIRTNSLGKYRLHGGSLPGISQTLVDVFDYEEELEVSSSRIAQEMAKEGATRDLSVFEFIDPNADRNGRQITTREMKVNPDTGEIALEKETLETYNMDGALVHRVETTHEWASYSQAVRNIKKEWSRIGVIAGGVSDTNSGGYLLRRPSSYEFKLMSIEMVEFGNFIGDTGLYEANISQYNLVHYILDEDTYNDEDIQVKRRPQIVRVNDQIGVTPSTWEEKDDPDSPLGWYDGLCLTRREQVRYNTSNPYILRKYRTIETFLPKISRETRTEDIPLKRGTRTDTTVKKWEYYKLTNPDETYSIYQVRDGDAPPSSFTGTNPGLFHPKMTLNCPDITEDYHAMKIAKRIFAKKVRKNTRATLRFTTPLPGISLGMIVNVPTCTKEVFDYNDVGWAEVELTGMMMWITGIRTVCSFGGSIGSSGRSMEFYTEIDLKKKY
jgi:hypothetical protein